MKSVTGMNKSREFIVPLEIEGQVISNCNETVNALNDYFVNIADKCLKNFTSDEIYTPSENFTSFLRDKV